MPKFFGAIGFASSVETSPGVWEDVIIEHDYRGEVINAARKTSETENLNDDLKLLNRLSIVSDPYATSNFFSIRYIIWTGVKWKVTKVDVQHPRLILTLGGVYNG